MILILDRQHEGKVSFSTEDRGAYPPNESKLSRSEVARTNEFAHYVNVEAGLESLEVITLLYGDYIDRHRQAINIARKYPGDKFLYAALHVNAGKTTPPFYSLIGYDKRSNSGKQWATNIKSKWEAELPGEDVRLLATSANAEETWIRNVYSTISGIYSGPNNIFGVCLELAFIADPRILKHNLLNQLAIGLVKACLT